MKRRELKIKNRASEWSMNIRSSPASLLRSKSSLSEGKDEDKILIDYRFNHPLKNKKNNV